MTSTQARRAVAGAAWLSSSGYTAFGLNFAANLILVRLLFPRDFGTFALASSAVELLSIFSGLAFSQGVIQLAREPDVEDTGYRMTLVLCGGLAALGIAVAGVLGVTRGPSIALLFLALFSVRLVSTLSYVYTAWLEREFQYRPLALIRLTATTAALGLVIALAARGAGVWSLVAREAMLVLITYAGLRLFTPWRYTGRFHRGTAQKLWAFGARMFVTRALEVVNFRVDVFVLGLLAGTVALGFYDRARFLSELGHYLVSFAAVQVAFPLYAKFKDDTERLAASYRIIHFFLIRAMLPVVLVLVIMPADVVLVLYGSTWRDSIPALPWLAGYAFFLPILDNVKVLLTGTGRLREAMLVRLGQVVTVIPLLAIAIPLWGVRGAAAAMTLSTGVGVIVAYRFLRQRIPDLVLRMYARPVWAGVLVALVLVIGRPVVLPAEGTRASSLIALAVLGVLYLGILTLLDRRELMANLQILVRLGTREGPAS